ncbi:hypothetical protein D3C71_1140220 [compost metagenome]
MRIAGREVRCRYAINDSTVPSRIATSMRMVTVAASVAAAIAHSPGCMRISCRQRGISSSVHATSNSNPEMAAFGIMASNGADKATSTTSSTAEKTAASGVLAPASKLGIDRFNDPQDK